MTMSMMLLMAEAAWWCWRPGGRKVSDATGSAPERKGRETFEQRWLRKNGWRRKGDRFVGYFRTGFSAWRGRVEVRFGDIQAFIHDPPRWMFIGEHGSCIMPFGGDWFLVHMAESPRSVIECIRGVEAHALRKHREYVGE